MPAEKFIKRHEDGSEEHEVSIINYQTCQVIYTTNIRMQPSYDQDFSEWQERLGKAFVEACKKQIDLSYALLDGIVLSDTEIDQRVNLSHASFRNARLNNVKFNAAELRGVDFSEAKIDKCTFADCCLFGAKFHDTNISGCRFDKTVLACSTFISSFVFLTDITNCDCDDIRQYDTLFYGVVGADHLNSS